MKHNFIIYYSKESQLPCVEYVNNDTVILMKAQVLECEVPTFGIYIDDTQGGRYWSMAGNADSIIQENNKITIL